MGDLFLIYINFVGKDYQGKFLYEFIFSDNLKSVDGNNWDTYPASGLPEPPHEHFIKNVGRLESELKLDVIQNSDTFAVWDAIDGVISLGWENINSYETYPEKRLSFKYGETIEAVKEKLYEKDLILNFNKIKNEERKKY